MVDACGTEQLNEFIVINSGGGFNTADIQLSYDINNNILGQVNNDINIDINNDALNPTPCGLIAGNTAAYSGCANFISVGPGVDIPANAIVVLQTSAGSSNNTYNFASLCGAGQCVYLISSSCMRTAGGFTNAGAGMRTTIFQINGGCNQTMTYNQTLLVGGNGAYYLPLTNTYGNGGCTVPPTSPAGSGATVNQPPNITVCAGDAVNVPFTGTGTTYNWTNSNVNIGLGASGSGDLNFTAAPVVAVQTGTITVTPIGTCPGPPRSFTITVRPLPSVNQPADVTVCAGAPVSVNFSGTAGATFSWTNDNTAIGLGASGNGNISFPSANVANQEVANITVTPTLAGCPGTPRTFTITINPTPTLVDPPNITVCPFEQVMVSFTGTASTYNWTNSNIGIGLPASGSGDLDFIANNVLSTQIGTITVTPVELGCPGTPQTFTITVGPAPSMNQPANITVCAGAIVTANFTGGGVGAIYNWINDNPNIGLADFGTGNLNFISANVTTQEVATITVAAQQGACQGPARTFTITVNPRPTVDNPGDMVVCAGDDLVIVFTGTGNPAYNWTNSNTAIGLGASGNGDIIFTASNVVIDQTGTITITPAENGCTGPAETFDITVTPLPAVNQPANITVCASAPVTVNFTGTTGASFSWTNNNIAIGLGASGNGNISFNAAAVLVQQVATITVTPEAGLCPGTPRTFTITVNPAPTVNDPPNITVCANQAVMVNFTGSPAATFTWTNNNIAIGLGASGSGNVNFTAANVGASQTGTITVTPGGGTCPGIPQTFTITVQPRPVLQATADQVFCNADTAQIIFTSAPAGAIFNWTNSDTTIGLPAIGSGPLNFVAASLTDTATATIIVTPSFGSCPGIPDTFTIMVMPVQTIDSLPDVQVCGGDSVQVNFTGTASSFAWTNSNPAIGLPASGTGDMNFMSAIVLTNQSATIIVTPFAGTCTGIPDTFTINVQAGANVNQPADVLVCGGTPVDVQFSGTPGATYTWTNSNPAIGLGASGTGDISFNSAAVTMQETGTITVTPNTGTCPGTPKTFTITVITAPTVTNPGNISTCGNEQVMVNFSGSATTYTWTNDNTAIGLPASGSGDLNFTAANVFSVQTAQITVTPQAGTCSGAPAVFTITVNLPPGASIGGLPTVCAGDSATLTANGGSSYVWESGEMTPSITVAPDSTTTYTVTVSNPGGCTNEASFVVTVIDSIAPTTVLLTSCNPADTGVVVQVLSGPFGCDSVVTTITSLLPSDSINLTQFTCNPNNAGVFTQALSNQFGCDSTVVTTIIFDPAAIDTTQLTATTCSPAQAGTVQVLLSGTDGCDSLVITTTTLLPSDSINLTQFTCNPSNAGIFTQMLVNQFGCDSTVITTILFDPALLDTTLLTATTCNASQAGTVQVLLTGADGCDSIVITTTTLLPSNSINLTQFTCNPGNAGTFTQALTNQFGCDSTVVTTIIFDPASIDTTLLTATTCNPAQAGTVQVLLTGVDGCDSLVITTTTLLPGSTISLTQTTCQANNAGTFTQMLLNQFGCDSIVITTITFDPALLDTTLLTAVTCDPTQAGTVQSMLTGVDGCDSLVVTTTTLLPGDVTNLMQSTCDPTQAGTFTQNLFNQAGCDSTVITTVVYDAAFCAIVGNLSAQSTTCFKSSDGSVTLTISNGQAPFQYNWTDGSGQTGSGQIAGLNTPLQINGLASGNFSISITQASTGSGLVLTASIPTPAPILAAANAVLTFNGFAVSCPGSADGSANASGAGGTPPYQYSWSSGASSATASGLAEGNYTVTVTDQNGCVDSTNVALSAPLPLDFTVDVATPDCGDTQTPATITASGGVGPYSIVVNGNPLTGNVVAFGSGQQVVEVTDNNGCAADSTFTLVIQSLPLISLPADTSIHLGESLSITAVTDLNVWQSISWQPAADTSCLNCLEQTWSPQQSALYTVQIVDTSGCAAKASIRVTVLKDLDVFIPNVFSPDGDGINDLFEISSGPSIRTLEEVRVFDRWGTLVYLWEEPVPADQWPGWDGSVGGKKVQVGVYVFYLKVRLVNGETSYLDGDLTIIRR